MKAFGFSLHKAGDAPNECMDAYSINTANGRFAVADGASTSIFAKEWSELLVTANEKISVRWEQKWSDWLPPLQDRWADLTRAYPLTWDAEHKLAEGAYSTFLNLQVRRLGTTSQWWATAVGDTCLFQIRDDSLLSAFPLQASQDFDNSPQLVGTHTDPSHLGAKLEHWRVGTCQRGDIFFLMTDALAQWFLASHERNDRPWHHLSMRDCAAYQRFIDGLRRDGSIQNDDASMVVVEVE